MNRRRSLLLHEGLTKLLPFFARMGLADLLAHERAQLWFGDLVTILWWDD